MSETNDSPRPPSVGEPRPVIFRAFQEEPARHPGRWALLLLSIPLVTWAVWGLATAATRPPTPLTPFGIRGVREGMTPQEVHGVLGQPFASRRSQDGRAECFQYGRPSLDRPSFPVFSLCYEGGKLRDMSVRHYTAQQVGRDGLPAPGEDDSAPF